MLEPYPHSVPFASHYTNRASCLLSRSSPSPSGSWGGPHPLSNDYSSLPLLCLLHSLFPPHIPHVWAHPAAPIDCSFLYHFLIHFPVLVASRCKFGYTQPSSDSLSSHQVLSLPNRFLFSSYCSQSFGETGTPTGSRVLWKYLEGLRGSFWVSLPHLGLMMNWCWIATLTCGCSRLLQVCIDGDGAPPWTNPRALQCKQRWWGLNPTQ